MIAWRLASRFGMLVVDWKVMRIAAVLLWDHALKSVWISLLVVLGTVRVVSEL
jgi:hypothetical protein